MENVVKNVMKLEQRNVTPARNAFDVSRKVKFTAKMGELLPVVSKFLIPNDYCEIDLSTITKTIPLNTQAFASIREYYDVYFVPCTQLWNKFGSFVTDMQKNSQHASGILSNEVVSKQPSIFINDIVTYLKRVKSLQMGGTPDKKLDNEVGFERGFATRKLLSYLGMGSYEGYVGDEPVTVKYNLPIHAWNLLAYQKIYSDYYRDSQWENAQSYCYNLDYMTGQSIVDEVQRINVADLAVQTGDSVREKCPYPNMLDLRYVNNKKDPLFGLLPNSQYGDEGDVPFNLTKDNVGDLLPILKVYHSVAADSPQQGTVHQKKKNSTAVGTTLYADSGYSKQISSFIDRSDVSTLADYIYDHATSTISIIQLRLAESMQKLKELQITNDQDFKSQCEALFGVKMPDELSEKCQWIDGFFNDISINEVVNTNLAESGRANLGATAGTAGRKKVTYHAKTYGVLMVMYHAEPIYDYDFSAPDLETRMIHYSDYIIPLLDDIGLQEVDASVIAVDSDFVRTLKNMGIDTTYPPLLGYAPRYYQFKTDYNVCRGGFTTNLKSWCLRYSDDDVKSYLNQFAGQKLDTPIFSSFFKINPHIQDKLFVALADDSYDSDCFIISANVNISKVTSASRYGLPY